MQKFPLAVQLGVQDHGQVMLQTYPVGEPPQGKGGAEEVAEFLGTVVGRGIVINVVVNMAFVDVRTDKELIFPLCPAHGRFIADFVCLFRGDLPLGERLPDLIAERPMLRRPSGCRLILALHKHKFQMGRLGVAEVRRHGPQLLRVQAVVKAILQTLQGRPLRGPLMGFDKSGCRGFHLLFNKKITGRQITSCHSFV